MSIQLRFEQARPRDALMLAVEAQRETLAAQSEVDEQLGTLSQASVEALVATGALRMKLPRMLGGHEADLVTQMEVLEQLAMINPSVGWCAMVGATSLALPAAFLPDAGIERLFPRGRTPRGAIVVTPSGVATPVEGGYRVSGRWSFASGVRHAEWVVAIAKLDGMPDAPPVVVVFPAGECAIQDNWQVLGLRGTGSCDIVLDEVFVPQDLSFPVTAGQRRGGALYRIPLPAFVAYEHAGFALGLARRILDGVVDMLKTKKRGYAAGGTTVADRGAVQRLIGHCEMRLRAARALAVEENEHVWALAKGEYDISPEVLCAVRSAATYATDVAVDVANEVFRHAGAAALHETHFLQRYLRDLQAAAQHYMVADTAYEQLGRARLGFAEVNPRA